MAVAIGVFGALLKERAARTRTQVELQLLKKQQTGKKVRSSVGSGLYEHGRAKRWTALLFLRTPKPKELQQLRELSAPKCHRHRRFCEMALPVVCLSACVLPSCSKGPLCSTDQR